MSNTNNSDHPIPLFRSQFILESESVSGNLLFDLAPDVNYIYWEIFSDSALVTLGIQETDANLEAIYSLANAQDLRPIVVIREDIQRRVVGNNTFENLRFKCMRSSLDVNSNEHSIAKVTFWASHTFDRVKFLP